MSQTLNKILHALSDLAALPNRLFLACSGGRDSLSLAFACYLLYQQGKLPNLPILLHVHHGMQKANDDWADLVKSWAQEIGFCCYILKVNLDKKTETYARDKRYQAMASMMEDGDTLLLAHHQNDQAETVLMRLISGTGVSGLSGIKKSQQKTIAAKKITLYRPFLSISRDEISFFAQFYHLPYVDDPTNETGENLRSVIRTQIMPVLCGLNPKAVQNIARSSQNFAQADTILKQTVNHHLQHCIIGALTVLPYQSVLDIDKIKILDKNIQTSLIHQWLQQDEILPPNHQIVQDILTLIYRQDSDHRTQIFWQSQDKAFVVCRYQNHLYRYLQTVWQFFTLPTDDGIHQEGQALLKTSHDLLFSLYLSNNMSVCLLKKTDKIQYHQQLSGKISQNKWLSGKKLYQTLKIPVWLRDNLWLISWKNQPLYLISIYHHWQLIDLDKMADLPKNLSIPVAQLTNKDK